jgi:hypothetical protein
MKQDAVLIPLDPSNVDFGALYEALDDQKIGGAILDVWPVYSCYNVIMLSLLGSVSFFDAGDTPTQDGCWGFKLDCGPPFGKATQPWAGKGDFRKLGNVRMTPNVRILSRAYLPPRCNIHDAFIMHYCAAGDVSNRAILGQQRGVLRVEPERVGGGQAASGCRAQHHSCASSASSQSLNIHIEMSPAAA